jgi:putative transferase (TIGR04331 family)
MNKVLVTTALEETWGEDEDELIFIGEWCKSYERKKKWSKRKYTTLPYHWTNREKLNSDYSYLEEFYERALDALSDFLNNTHSLDKSKSYWRMIVGPWLLTYIAVLWDRWECLRCATNNYNYDSTISLSIDEDQCIPVDYSEFTIFFNSHIWNHYIYNKIIKFYGIKAHQKKSNLSIQRKKVVLTRKAKTTNYLNKIISCFSTSEKVFFTGSCFKLKPLIMLCFKLKQLPIIHTEFTQIKRDNVNLLVHQKIISNRSHVLDINTKNDFEDFASANIVNQLPLIFLEGFQKVLSSVASIKTSAKMIFTAGSHFNDNIFQIWCAEQVANGKKLIVSSHGGAIPSRYNNFNHESKISYQRVVWGIDNCNNCLRLSVNKMIGQKRAIKQKNYLALIGMELPIYSYRCQSGPNSSLLLEDYQKNIEFCSMLSKSVFDRLKIRPYPVDYGWNMRQRYIDDLGLDKISSEKLLTDLIYNSKLVVCTYPQTTFFEAMFSGNPVVLIYMEKYWELDSTYSDLIEQMKDAKIVFSSPTKAADHINSIWDNPMHWWESDEVISVRDSFFDYCGRVDGNWIDEWSCFFENELKNIGNMK